jgi:hypothetical protein
MPRLVRRRSELRDLAADLVAGMSREKQTHLRRYLQAFKRQNIETAITAFREEVAEKIERITLAGMAKGGAWEELAGMWCLAGDLGVAIDHATIGRQIEEREGKALAAEYRRRATEFVLTTTTPRAAPTA